MFLIFHTFTLLPFNFSVTSSDIFKSNLKMISLLTRWWPATLRLRPSRLDRQHRKRPRRRRRSRGRRIPPQLAQGLPGAAAHVDGAAGSGRRRRREEGLPQQLEAYFHQRRQWRGRNQQVLINWKGKQVWESNVILRIFNEEKNVNSVFLYY